MSDVTCHFAGDREQVIVSYLYDEWEGSDRDAFERHLSSCPRCRTEIAALSHARGELRAWAPPAGGVLADSPSMAVDLGQVDAGRRRSWWREAPGWAQAAAAVLVLGVAAGAANLDVHYDHDGLTVRTGWSKPAEEKTTTAATADAPWRADLAALEQRLRAESSRTPAAAVTPAKVTGSAAAAASGAQVDPEVLRRVRVLIDESEHRQERELALRVAEVLRDVNAERQSDLARIERTMGVIQNTTGIEMMRQRETINNLLVRTSLQK